ncbi:Diacylglycerol O-acyltransferase 2A [Purpureocillium lavendulum]|uniref:arginine--tRNA ligase n=1 Tax=Purpureocillium lavendulum TaxID=1247861 RepID=A0AB34G4Q9_9HYPO|nr:Diacylglycerol O-acyltransferase 2A [Purpureocillium lavendulum]
MARKPVMELFANHVKGMSLDSVRKSFPSACPEANPLDLYRAHLSNVLAEISGVAPSALYPVIMRPQGLDKGDFNIAVPALRLKGPKPDVLAAEWSAKFPVDDALFAAPIVNGSFLSFFVKPEPLSTTLATAGVVNRQLGRNDFNGLKDPEDPSQGRKRVIVEFSSPNVAKPFHAGHIRSTIIGSFTANVYEANGWDVLRINYLGDWGKQYGLLAVAYERNGSEEELKKNPIDHLFKLYVQINKDMKEENEAIKAKKEAGEDVSQLEANSLDEQARQYFRNMTNRDERTLAQWQRFRDLSIERYQKTYSRLGVHFDEYSGESQVSEESMAKMAETLKAKGVTREDNGAVLVDFTQLLPGKEGKQLGITLVRKKDGTALYLTRDICELLGRYEKYKYDHMIYVVGAAQNLHLSQLFKLVELLGHEEAAKKCQHVNFGLVRGMSTRKGTAKFLDDIFADCADYMHEKMKQNEAKYALIENPEATADILGISGVMVQDMSGKRINDYDFNMDAMTSLEGDTGPYLQYAHARLCSIKRRAALSDEDLDGADLTLLTETHATNVVRMLAQWPDVLKNALRTLEPTTILTYMFKTAHVVSSSYDQLQVVGSERELMRARMALYDAARIVLSNGMRILGLTPLERSVSGNTLEANEARTDNVAGYGAGDAYEWGVSGNPIVRVRRSRRCLPLGTDAGTVGWMPELARGGGAENSVCYGRAPRRSSVEFAGHSNYR